MAKIQLSDNSGFTLLEIIAVLIIIGILCAVAISRANSTNESELSAFASELKANLRYAQSNAMTTESICAVAFTGNSYKYQDGDNNDQVLPGQNQINITAPSGISVSTTAASNTISFDTWGRPGTSKTDDDSDGLLDTSAGSTITVSNSSGDSITLVITQETGLITQ